MLCKRDNTRVSRASEQNNALPRKWTAARTVLCQLVANREEWFHKKGYKTSHMVMQGEAAESLLVAAEKYKPDIIALGAKGRTNIESFFIGSVTERIARYARCSVLIGRG